MKYFVHRIDLAVAGSGRVVVVDNPAAAYSLLRSYHPHRLDAPKGRQ